jgi:hypothetical protein
MIKAIRYFRITVLRSDRRRGGGKCCIGQKICKSIDHSRRRVTLTLK